MGLSQQTVDVFFGLAHIVNVLGELLHEALDPGLTTLQLAVDGIQSLLLLAAHHIPHLLILSCQSFLPIGRCVLGEDRERIHINRLTRQVITGFRQNNRNTLQNKNLLLWKALFLLPPPFMSLTVLFTSVKTYL